MISSRHQKDRSVALNGEVRVVRSDLASTYDKTQTKRIEGAVSKVISLAEKNPDMEQMMEE